MQQGVVRVWTDSSRSVEIGQLPGNDYDFFSDMQRCVSMCLQMRNVQPVLKIIGGQYLVCFTPVPSEMN